MSRHFVCYALCCVLYLWTPLAARAGKPADELLPDSTKGVVIVPRITALVDAWNATQLGQLCQDPEMKPFIADLWGNVRNNLSETHQRLGMQFEQILELAAGEVGLASLEPQGEDSHAVVLLIDVTPGSREVDAVLSQIHQTWSQRGATRHTETLQGYQVVRYDVPAADGQHEAQHAYYLAHKDKFIATDHVNAMQAVLQRLGNATLNSLSSNTVYRATQEATVLEGGQVSPHVRWFIEPFGYARVLRASTLADRKRGKDMLKSIQNQGFDVLQGIGGQVAFHTAEHEILHRTLIYAPGEKKLAANMLHFPNGGTLHPESWVPHNISNYVSFRWDMRRAFEAMAPLVNELAGENFFEEFLDNLANDPNGPRTDVRRDLVRHLGQHVTFISDCTHPITPQCERFIVAIEVTDTDAVARTVNQALQADPLAKKHDFDGLAVWEIVNEEPEEDLMLTVEFGSGGFGFGAPEPEPIHEENAPALPNAAVAVSQGRLMISSHIEYLREVLQGDKPLPLSATADYQRVNAALERLGAGLECSRIFSRTDETYHATYELVREGRMPESESLLGRLLNYTKSDPTTGIRHQTVDGTKLPAFESVQRYLGPAGFFTETRETGWVITGCLLAKTAQVKE